MYSLVSYKVKTVEHRGSTVTNSKLLTRFVFPRCLINNMEINNREIRVKGFHSLVFLHVICVVDCCHNVDWILCLPLLCWLVDSGCIKSSVTSVTYSSEKISMALINISLIGLSGCYRKTRDWMKSCVCSEVGCSLGLELCILGLVCCTQTLTKGWNNIFF